MFHLALQQNAETDAVDGAEKTAFAWYASWQDLLWVMYQCALLLRRRCHIRCCLYNSFTTAFVYCKSILTCAMGVSSAYLVFVRMLLLMGHTQLYVTR